ncbi:hypothetical protein [Bdellovibrio bacteriovorus]|uniref:Lipoprotein n=1 Tax=Bdellovibrio bacteriovorus str. Tiberius TaxID=1069642 RepID=K7Z8H5_BDEBC|nr:hypothetical protein [Bdellovibrio bacteriovorus]AFY00739.1 Hypothetical protein Bdt_1039 [Bdellovibrio bacteriovorus str. Tiberius]
MKKFVLVVLMGLASMMPNLAAASGCGGPEYYRESTKVLSTSLFKDAVENHTIYLTTTIAGPLELQVSVYAELMPQPDYPSFYWHKLYAQSIPQGFDIQQLEALLNAADTRIEMVEDFYSINCGNPSEGTSKNLRMIVNYNGELVEFRSGYLPDSY